MSSGNGRSRPDIKHSNRRSTNGTLDKIWERYKKSGSTSARNQLIEHYLPLGEHIAEQLYLKLPNSIEMDDLMSAGVFGLMDSIDAFDQRRNIKFERFAYRRIRGAMLDELRNIDWVPRLVRSRANFISGVRDRLKKLFGYNPGDSQVQEELGMSHKEYERFLKSSTLVSIKSLDAEYLSVNSSKYNTRLHFEIDSKSPDPLKNIDRNSIKEVVSRGFCPRERLLIILYYYERMTLKEIGKVLGYCEATVCAMHRSILKRLRAEIQKTGTKSM